MATIRKIQVIKHSELKTADLNRTDDIESNSERIARVRQVINRLEERCRHTRNHENNTFSVLFDFLRELNERIGALEAAKDMSSKEIFVCRN